MSDDLVEIRGDGDSIEDIWLNGYPIGKLLDSANQRITELENQIQELESESADGGVSPEVRSRVLEIHQDLFDLREGRTARFEDAANARRAALLFRRFIRKFAGDAETGVVADQGTLKLGATTAKEILANEDRLPSSGHSTTIKRVFRDAVRRSNHTDCSCDWEECSHALFQYRKPDTYQLVADEGRLDEYLHSVAELVEEVELSDSDDAGNSVEEDLRRDATNELDALSNGAVADDVVSRGSRPASAAVNGHGGDT